MVETEAGSGAEGNRPYFLLWGLDTWYKANDAYEGRVFRPHPIIVRYCPGLIQMQYVASRMDVAWLAFSERSLVTLL